MAEEKMIKSQEAAEERKKKKQISA